MLFLFVNEFLVGEKKNEGSGEYFYFFFKLFFNRFNSVYFSFFLKICWHRGGRSNWSSFACIDLFFLILDVILLKLFVISFFSKWVQLIFVDGYDFLQLLLIYWIFYVCL